MMDEGPSFSKIFEHPTTAGIVTAPAGLQPSSTSHLERCPPEILSQIFVDCLPEDFSGQEGQNIDSRDQAAPGGAWAVPILLTQLSKRLRRTAIHDTPALWSQIKVTYGSTQISHPSVFQTWLDRTRGTSLSVHLTDKPFLYMQPADGEEILENLFTTCSRWSTLAVNFSENGAVGPRFSAAVNPGSLASLRHLEMLIGDGLLGNEGFGYNDWFVTSAPTLDSVRVSYENFTVRDSTPNLPWAQLRRYQSNAHVDRTVSLLPQMPSLSTLVCLPTTVQSQGDITTTVTQPHITHNLRNLVIGCYFQWLDHRFFDNLTLPMLKSIWLVKDPAGYTSRQHTNTNPRPKPLWGEQMHTSFMTFLSRSSCHLHTFSFTNLRISHAQLTDILTAMPSLRHLQLGGDHFTASDKVLSLLTTVDSESAETRICPHLQHLSFFAPWFFSMKALISLAQSRFATDGVDSLQKISLLFHPRFPSRELTLMTVKQVDELTEALKASQPKLKVEVMNTREVYSQDGI